MTDDIKLEFHLHPKQLEIFQSTARFNVTVAGRRGGKSHLATVKTVVKALDPANVKKKPVYIVAPVSTQAKLTYWQPLLDYLHPMIKNVQGNEGHIFLQNGVMIGVKGSDRPDTLRSVGLYHVTLDEYADMKPEVWESILRPTLTDVRGTADFIGTPKGRNHFYDLYEYAASGVDSEWAAFSFFSADNVFLPTGEVEAAKKSLSSQVFRQEYMASFETGGADVFKREWVKYEEEPKNEKGEPKPGDWYVAADLAGFADVARAVNIRQRRLDQAAVAVVKIFDDGKWWVRDLYIGRWGVEETAKRIVDAVDSVKAINVGIEKGALFNAVAPTLTAEAAKRRIPLRPEPLSHENRSKIDRIVWALQGRLEHGTISFRRAEWNKDLEDQLINFPSKLVHDDMLDALAFIAQLAEGRVFDNFGYVSEESYWEPMDKFVGV